MGMFKVDILYISMLDFWGVACCSYDKISKASSVGSYSGHPKLKGLTLVTNPPVRKVDQFRGIPPQIGIVAC